MTGEWPEKEIDHINHDKKDNRWRNLRLATRKENGRNKGLHKNNKSGFCGVSWIKSIKKWYANIEVSGKAISLGHYDLIIDAVIARMRANKRYRFHDNHGK